MPKRIYNGPFPEVELILPDGSRHVVKRGESTGELDKSIVGNLDLQGEDWLTPGKGDTKTAEEQT